MRELKSWDEVTIKDWIELSSIENELEMTTLIEQMSIAADIDCESIRDMSIKDFGVFQETFKWLAKPPASDIKVKFELNGKKYGMIPHLDFISAGEWMDAEAWKEKPIENIHLYAAMIYRPILTEDEDDYTIEKHKVEGFNNRPNNFLNNLPITTIYGAVLFFSSLGLRSMMILADYLEEQTKEDKKKMKKKSRQTRMKKQS